MKSSVWEKIKSRLDYLDTAEGQLELDKYFSKKRAEQRLLLKRFRKFTFYLKKHSFKQVMDRLISEHDELYRERCYQKGHEPHPNRKFYFVMQYTKKYGITLKYVKGITDGDYMEECWKYKNYYFHNIHGQGTITRVYNGRKKLLLQV